MNHRWLPDTAGYAVMWTPGMVSIFRRGEQGEVRTDIDPTVLTLDELRAIGQAILIAENRHIIEQEINLTANTKETP